MQSEQQYSNLVYEYFLEKIKFSYYKYGDSLPSIDTLCRELSVSAQTVKTAFKRLRAEGYIDMHNGRLTKVIFKQDQDRLKQLQLQYFSCRTKGFQDLCYSTNLIVIPLLLEGFCRSGQKDLTYLTRLADGTSADDILHFFCFVLQKMDNPLIMNLYWEITFYWGLLFLEMDQKTTLADLSLMHEDMKRCVALAKKGSWPQLHEELRTFCDDSIGKAVGILTETVPPSKDSEQIPFTWRIYRERPQVCYSLASRLLHEIYMGSFRNAGFLPSYEKMAAKYEVSVSTVRRTVGILSQLGTVRPVNGKGTLVFGIGEACDSPDFESPAVRRNLSYFLQAFELLAYSCETVMRNLLNTVTQEERDLMIGQLEGDLETGRYELSLWNCLLFITKYSRLNGVKEIYGRIYSLFLWGYPLKSSRDVNPDLDQAIIRFTKDMILNLKRNDMDGCAGALMKLIRKLFPAAERYLISQGFRAEELRLAPSIRLLVAADEL